MFVFSPAKLERNVSLWKKCLPSIKPYYAMKCNPHPFIITKLSQLKVNFECAAVSEISSCLSTTNDIIYGHPHKTVDQIQYAKTNKINKIVYDSLSQLKLIHQTYPDALPILRIKSNEKRSEIKFNQKFGASDEELDEIVSYHKREKFPLLGISFHVGSKCYYPEQYLETIEKIYSLDVKYNLKLRMIDIGGGFPSIDDNFTETNFIGHTGIIDRHLLKHTSLDRYNIVAEPGRFIVDNVLKFIVKVINKKVRDNTNIYYINDSVYGSLNGVMFDGRKIPSDKELQNYPTILYGQTCDSVDKIECNIPEYNIGDEICFNNFGAYTWCAASTFNGFPIAEWVLEKD